MKKRKMVWFALAVAAGVGMAACGRLGGSGKWNADKNSIYVMKSLEVRSVMVFTSAVANELYDQEELAQDTREWVQDYNKKNRSYEAGQGNKAKEKLPVALASCTLENGTGTLIFDYGTAEDFVRFSQEVGDNSHTVKALSVGIVEDMLSSEKMAGIRFFVPDGREADGKEVSRHAKYRVIAMEGAATLCTEGKVAYVSSEDAVIQDDYTVTTGEGLHYIVFQ